MKDLRVFPFVSALLIAAFAFGALGAPSVKAQQAGTLVDVALAANAQTGEFSILIAALQAANPNILGRLSSQKEYTVFAPTDAAFTALLAELGVTADQLLSDQELLSRVLRYHIVRGSLDSTEVLARERIGTLQGALSQANGVLTDLNGRTANIVTTDIQASNGFIHVIDRVVLPRIRPLDTGDTILDVALAANDQTGEFSILIAALEAASPSLIERLNGRRDHTVFAPTDAAFLALLDELGITAEQLLSDERLVTRVLRYHIARGELDSSEVLASESIETLQGGPLFQSGGVLTDEYGRTSNIVTVDIQASNGIIHVIDRVVLPQTARLDIGETILDVALATNAATGEFSILVAALNAANPEIVERLDSRREYTVFAPTDAAFQALLAELGLTADQLLSDEPTLSRVLRYHIARGKLEAAEVLASERIQTLQGGRLWQSGGVLTDANGRSATIIATDIQASNGVIHVIDRVILPKSKPVEIEGSIVDTALTVNAQTGEFSLLIAALQAANPSIIRSLSRAGEYTVFAPTDAAFLDLLDELGLTADQLLGDRALVSRVLRYHIVREELDSSEVLASERIRTWQGSTLFQSGGVLTDANSRTANIIDVDIQTSNGIIHVIDRVVLPKAR